MKILITGAAGRIGHCLRHGLAGRHEMRLFDREPIAPCGRACHSAGCRAASDEARVGIVGDLNDLEALRRACEGAEAVVHLAGTRREAPFVEDLVPNNIVGTYNVLEAARQSGVRRVVFASSAQSVAAYPKEREVTVADEACPSSLYGAAKVLGESMGRYYFDKCGLEFVGLRIGWLLDASDAVLRRDGYARRIWLSPRDCVQLFARALEAPSEKFEGCCVAFGTSLIRPARLRLDEARALGYEPLDDIALIPIEKAIEKAIEEPALT